LLGAGSISDEKPVSSSPASCPLVLVVSSRPFLVLCFGSWVAPEPPQPAFSAVPLALLRAQAWLRALVQAWPLASEREAAVEVA